MPLGPIPGLTSRGVVGKWLASQAAAGALLTVDENGDVLTATSGQVQTAADLPSALSPYLLSALAANTYVPQSRTITINGTTQDLTANRSWTITTTPAAGSIANSQLANVATSTIKGRISASTGVVEDLTPAQARSVLGLATTDAPTFAAVTVGAGTVSAPAIAIGASNDGFYVAANEISATIDGVRRWRVDEQSRIWQSACISSLYCQADGLGYYSRSDTAAYRLGVNDDCNWVRDAANTWAARNGANAQRINLYGSFTDAANFRRLSLTSTTAGVFGISAEGQGTGASGNFLFLGNRSGVLGHLKIVSADYAVTIDAEWGAAGNAGAYITFANAPFVTGASLTNGLGPNMCNLSRNQLGFGYSTNASIGYRNDYPVDYVPGIFTIGGNDAWISATVNRNGGQVRLHGGAAATGGQPGAVVLAHTGSVARGRVLIGTITDDNTNLVQIAGSILATGNVTFSGLPTTNPGVAGRLWNDGGILKVS